MRVVTLLAALAAALASTSPTAAQSPGRVAGRAVTPYAELVPEAAITLSPASGVGGSLTTTSNDAGAFAFEDVTPGVYELSATKAGYTTREVAQGRLRSTQEVTVGDGARLADVEITLRRTGSIAGRIVRPDGTPAPGAQVMTALRDAGRLTMLHETRTTSEWDGRYEIADLPPGEFLVIVLPPPAGATSPPLPVDVSPAPLAFQPTLYPGVPEHEPGGTVTVYEGTATEGIDVWLMPAPQRFAVSGRVFWPDGLDVENITIEYGGSPEVRSGVWVVEDPGGLFTLEGISRGPLVLLARAESSRGPLLGIAATDVTIGPVEEVRLDLAQPGRVSGRIVSDAPLPAGSGARVSLTHTLLTVSPLFPREEAVVAANGSFAIPHARGIYAIDVHDLPSGWSVRRIERNGIPLRGGTLIVDPGREVANLEIVVGPHR